MSGGGSRHIAESSKCSNPSHYAVHNSLTDEVINLSLSTRIYENTTVEWILPAVAAALSWPVSYVKLVVGQTVVTYAHRIRERTETYMKHFECADKVLIIQATKIPRPATFTDSYPILCLCDFGRCCCYCVNGCAGSGNSGCCRSGNCGHDCCESYQENPLGGRTGDPDDCCRVCGN